jgi:hypothetical protein
MSVEQDIATHSERIATGTSILRVRGEDAERAERNGVEPSAWSEAARKLSRMKARVWAKIA